MKKQLLFWSMLIGVFTIGSAQINIPDANFKAALLAQTNPEIDTDRDDEISIAEALTVTTLVFSSKEIQNVIGIEYFTNLTELRLYNNNIESINLSENINLEILNLSTNNLDEIDLSNNIKLEKLTLSSNNLDDIDLSKHINLEIVFLESNNLTNIEVSDSINLEYLSLHYNELDSINVSNNINLKEIGIQSNNLSDIDVSNNINLTGLFVGDNNLNSIDVRNCKIRSIDFDDSFNLKEVYMTGQPLGSGFGAYLLDLENCPNLQFICADQEYLEGIYSLLEDAEQTGCLLSSDCDDKTSNLIQGNLTYDVDNDGCGDADDVLFIHKIPISILSGNGQPITAYPNEEGRYIAFVNDGEYKIIPDLASYENYFQIFNQPVFDFFEPGTSIPDDINNLVTDFCIQPIGDFDDLEVAIYPISRAIPGFDATYQVLYTNNGTTTQSGTITLDYDSDVLTFNSSVPGVVSDTNGQLTWNFSNLSLFETITIPLSFTLNTPTDSPALNGDDILNFTATITGAIDETPDNNVMELVQTVVNSYDPNDKTCLEGDILDPDDVGGYLHYLIRFENEGSAEARTIRVTDAIDTTKFDIKSFVPLKSSHSYTTVITNESEVEFTFSDINLPFDDATNDGYVFFKIKTLDTLVEGDEIVNGAAIYFDFNFPVITEDSVVEVKREEESSEPEFSDYFTLSPNPTTGIVNLEVLDNSIEISYILLYDLNGVFRGFFYGTVRTIDITEFYARTYVMQVLTNKGDFSTQFIKL